MDALKKLGRANLAEIAAAVNLPQSNTLNRLEIMLENGQVECIDMDGQDFYELR
jgi:DNA-binding Lrp family transcriptional regulator